MPEQRWAAAAQLHRRLVPKPLLTRAERLVRSGKLELVSLGSVRVEASIQAAWPLRVELGFTPRGTLSFFCSCGARHAVCFHALATLLAASEARPPAASSPGPAAPSGQTPPAGPIPGMPRVKLEAWAQEAGVGAWLKVRAYDALANEFNHDHWLQRIGSSGWSLGDLICKPDGQTPLTGLGSEVPGYLAQAACELLRQRQAEMVAGRQEEKRWLAALRRPSDPELARVWERLLALRQELRRQAYPRPREAQGQLSLVVQLEPPVLIVRERVLALCGGNRNETPIIRISLGSAQEPASTTCDCHKPVPGGCPVVLAAVDVALDFLATEPRRAEAKQLAEWLAIPEWERTVRRLELALTAPPEGEPTPDGAPAELGWRIHLGPSAGGEVGPVLDRFRLEPVLVRPKKAGRGLMARRFDSRLTAQQLLQGSEREAWLLCETAAASYSTSRNLELYTQALGRLAGHARVLLARGSRLDPVAVRRATASLAVRQEEGGAVRIAIAAGGRELPPAHVPLLARVAEAGGPIVLFDAAAAECTVLEVPPRLARLAAVLKPDCSTLPPEAAATVVERLMQAAGDRLPCRIDERLSGRRVEADQRPLVRLERLRAEGLEVSLHVRPLPELPSYPPGEGPELLHVRRGDELVHVRRDLAAEAAACSSLAESCGLPATGQEEPFRWTVPELERCLTLLERLAVRAPEQAVVEWASKKRYDLVERPAGPADLRLHLREQRGGWFALGGRLELDGTQVELAELLRAMRERQGYVRVEGDRWARISEELQRHLGPAARVAGGRAGSAELPRFAAPLLEPLAEAGAVLAGPRSWQELQRKLHEAAALTPELPAELAGVLRGYQVEGFRWLARLAHWGAGACLADDMGLGKTLQALALLLYRAGLGPALVVAPTTVVFNWQREAERFAPSLRLRSMRSGAELDVLAGLGPGDVVVTSYGMVVRQVEALAGLRFATIVLDESQAIKNAATHRARAVLRLQGDCRVALSGTPLENRPGELWSLFSAIVPGLLGSAEAFRERFALPIERNRDDAAREMLARLIRPFILRRVKEQVAPELPPRTEVRLDVELSGPERRLYDELRGAALAALARGRGGGEGNGRRNGSGNGRGARLSEEQRRFQVLAALTRLRQLACHPRLVDPSSTVPSAKLRALRELLGELHQQGHRALVFSQFTSHLALVREVLGEIGLSYRYLDGSTPGGQRRAEIDAFQAGEGDVFLLSLKAGGTGVNLTAADYVIFLDPWWNPAVEEQAADRAHRIGQQRPVTIYRLVARDTIEEGILSLQESKRELVQALLDGTGTAASLSTDELLALIEASGRWSGEEPDDEPEQVGPADGNGARRLLGAVRRSSALEPETQPADGNEARRRLGAVRPDGAPGPETQPADGNEARRRLGAVRPDGAPGPETQPPAAGERQGQPQAQAQPAEGGAAPVVPHSAEPPLLARLATVLEQALQRQQIVRRATVSSYLRIAGRVTAFATAHALPLDRNAVDDTLHAYCRAVAAGKWPAPPSDKDVARSLGRWLALADGAGSDGV